MSKKKLLNRLICQYVATVFPKETSSNLSVSEADIFIIIKTEILQKALVFFFCIYYCLHGTKSSMLEEEF